jgi:hypothetical protein
MGMCEGKDLPRVFGGRVLGAAALGMVEATCRAYGCEADTGAVDKRLVPVPQPNPLGARVSLPLGLSSKRGVTTHRHLTLLLI